MSYLWIKSFVYEELSRFTLLSFLSMLIYYDKTKYFDKLFLAAHSCSSHKNYTMDVSYPTNDLFLILGLDILYSFDCLGSKICNFIQDMKPAVRSNSAKLS